MRRILTLSFVEFLAPEFLFEELGPHLPVLRSRARLAETDAAELLQVLKGCLTVIPGESLRPFWADASAAMAAIDPRDTAYVAAALALPCDGVWSDDEHLRRQRRVRCWTTTELLEELRPEGFEP